MYTPGFTEYALLVCARTYTPKDADTNKSGICDGFQCCSKEGVRGQDDRIKVEMKRTIFLGPVISKTVPFRGRHMTTKRAGGFVEGDDESGKH